MFIDFKSLPLKKRVLAEHFNAFYGRAKSEGPFQFSHEVGHTDESRSLSTPGPFDGHLTNETSRDSLQSDHSNSSDGLKSFSMKRATNRKRQKRKSKSTSNSVVKCDNEKPECSDNLARNVYDYDHLKISMGVEAARSPLVDELHSCLPCDREYTFVSNIFDDERVRVNKPDQVEQFPVYDELYSANSSWSSDFTFYSCSCSSSESSCSESGDSCCSSSRMGEHPVSTYGAILRPRTAFQIIYVCHVLAVTAIVACAILQDSPAMAS
ncbi:hypothetical protein HDE_08176 [Halotydeus destructor]|nr:hypothetical protein HDE_08176 [Halotydeus destructor]